MSSELVQAALEEIKTQHAQDINRVNECLDTIEKQLTLAGADTDGAHVKKVSGVPKASSNQHPKLKVSELSLYSLYTQRTNPSQPLVHSMFFEMCGLEITGTKTERTLQLCSMKPLTNGNAFEVINDKEVWHPNWAGNLNDQVNTQFVHAAVDRIYQNEEVSISSCVSDWMSAYRTQRLRTANNGTGDIETKDFSKAVITSCAKIYFQNVHKQYTCRFNTPDKYKETLIAGRHRARRQGVSNSYESVFS
jgi:hypothetical protein